MASYNGLLAAAAPSSPVRPMPSLVDALKSAGTAGESPVKLHGLTSVAVATRDSADLSQGVAAMSLTTVAEGLSGQKVVDSREAVGSTAAAASTLHTGGVSKRADYLHWDDYFMAVAFLSAMRSKGSRWRRQLDGPHLARDPSTQVGACIVDGDQRIVGIGYNGFPRGCSDDDLPWARSSSTGDDLETKYPYVCHAEMNAILNKNSASLKGCRIYVALFPCNECTKLIIQSGIVEVIFVSDKYHNKPPFIASRRMLDMAKVTYRQYTPTTPAINIDFSAAGR